jgi:type IV secretory pathway VirB10-like protein
MEESVAPNPPAPEAPSAEVVAEQAVAPTAPPAAAPEAVKEPEEKKRSWEKDKDKERHKEKHREKHRSRSRSREKKKHKESKREEPVPVKIGLPIKSASGWAVMVGGLEGGESDSSLRDRFSAYGMVGRIFLNRSLRTGLATSALIEFEVATEAEAAIASCNGRAGFAVLDNI